MGETELETVYLVGPPLLARGCALACSGTQHAKLLLNTRLHHKHAPAVPSVGKGHCNKRVHLRSGRAPSMGAHATPPPPLTPAQIMFALFASCAAVWSWFVWRERQHAHRVHILMATLCVFKAFTLMAQVRLETWSSTYALLPAKPQLTPQ